MKSNVGSLDRILRIIIGIVLAVLYLKGTVTGGAGVALLVVGLVLIVTALIKWCPIWKVLGVNTCPR